MSRHYEKLYDEATGVYLGLIFQWDDGAWVGENRLGDNVTMWTEVGCRRWLASQVVWWE